MVERRPLLLFVCAGNTCRSPLAEGLARALLADRSVTVASAGLTATAGAPAHPETLAALARRGLALPGFASRPLTARMLEEATLVLVMTRAQAAAIASRFPEQAAKVALAGDGQELADPLDRGPAAYEQVASALEAALPRVLGRLGLPCV